jgi:hypothetical protein
MRQLISAYEAECKRVLGEAGWRRRTGIYTFDLASSGYFAWLGRNTATKHHPLRVNPVVGIRCEPLAQALKTLLPPVSGRQYVTATLAVPVGYLTPEQRYLTLEVPTLESAVGAADETERLARVYGIPLAKSLASDEALLAEFQNHTMPSVNTGEYEVPVLLAMTGRQGEAREAVERLLRDPRRQGLADQDAYFANAFSEWLAAR